MASIMETLILQGILPFDQLERVSRTQTDDESAITGLVTQGLVTPVQLARARATQAGIEFVELLEYPVDRTAVMNWPSKRGSFAWMTRYRSVKSMASA